MPDIAAHKVCRGLAPNRPKQEEVGNIQTPLVGQITSPSTRGLVELRRYAETRYAAKSWGADTRRVVARVEASSLGLDIRFVVTSLKDGSAEHIYDTLYSARGQAENLIKLHKAQLKSDRTSCRSRPTPTRCASSSTLLPIG